MGQINGLQVRRQVGGQSIEVIIAEVEDLQLRHCVVDEDGPLYLVAREVEGLQVPVVDRVVLVQQLDAVGRGVELPEGARQTSGKAAQPVVGEIQDTEVGVRGEPVVQMDEPVVGQVEGEDVMLQAVGELSQAPPETVHLSVAAAAGAHGGAHGQDAEPEPQHEHQLQEGLIKKRLQHYGPAGG